MSTERRTGLVVALVVAVVTLVGSVAYAATAVHDQGRSTGSGPMGSGMGSGMGQVWLVGDGSAVASIASARARAAQAASTAGLRPGEVMWFDNGFYVELKDAAGNAATEVIVDPVSGAVTTEPGPAMMWNTQYGMHGKSGMNGGAGTQVSVAQARTIAQQWLDANKPGQSVASVDAYPGYFTADIALTSAGVAGDSAPSWTLTGMLSVNATTGQVWFHTWHGTFIAREDS